MHVANKSAKQLLEKERALTFGLITDCIYFGICMYSATLLVYVSMCLFLVRFWAVYKLKLTARPVPGEC